MSEQETIGVLEVYEDVTMREARLDDAALVWQAIYDHRDYLKTWLPFVLRLHTVEDEEAFLREVLAVPFEERNLVMVIEKKGVFCGLIGFVTTDRVNHRTEIGYWLLPEFQGQGIMTRCVRCLCEWAVQYRGMQRIQIRCAVGNVPSNAIPKRLGFRWEGIERAGELMISGEYANLNVYSILKNEIFP
ncbi:GNAT family N-acetyltransferase [Culturomica massiliensis]|nr:GNAT family N-acetyltransferase [Culturomica massiliensis]